MINSSGGKDSQTALAVTVAAADEAGVPRSRLVVVHADLGRMEWPGVKQLAREQAEYYNLEFVVEKYRNKAGENLTLLDYVRKRGKWPDAQNRYCTSDFKRGPCSRTITALSRRVENRSTERPARVLSVFGFRSQESPARAKHEPLAQDKRASNKTRHVDTWLPIHDWSEEEVWSSIKTEGVPYHEAYDLGMPRLSCCFCIFAPKGALQIAGKHNPELLQEYVQVENDIDHTFKHKFSLAEMHDEMIGGAEFEPVSADGCWNM
jgi:3'-phosphoadenosine 5'-phosphosulfate sulfotransferase (PAPS reductase)/FAD synthetase